MERLNIKMEKIYKHYKGGYYKLLSIARHSETLDEMVVYQALYGEHVIWVRPAKMFFGTVTLDGKDVPRFIEIEDAEKQSVKVNIKKMYPDAKMPTKAHNDDFCYDCYAHSEKEIAPGVWKYGLGFGIQCDDKELKKKFIVGFTGRSRSSVCNTGMVLSSGVATIDNFTGELSAVYYHVFPNMPRYRVGDKVMQLHIDTTYNIEFNEVDELKPTERGDGGYGSTGK